MNGVKRFWRRHKNQICLVFFLVATVSGYVLIKTNHLTSDHLNSYDSSNKNLVRDSEIYVNGERLLSRQKREGKSFDLEVVQSDPSIHHIVKRSARKDAQNVSMLLFSSWTRHGGTVSKGRVYRNIIRNWNSFQPAIQPLVFTSDRDVFEEAVQNQWHALPEKSNRKCAGPPLLPHMYVDAKMHVEDAFIYGFSNADILFSDNLLGTIKFLETSPDLKNKSFMVIGRRTNFDFHLHPAEFISKADIDKFVSEREQVQKSSDYFFTTADFPWDKVAPLSIGRPAFCRWVMSYAHKIGAIVIDATITISALHLTTEDGNRSSWHLTGNGVHCNEDVIESFPEKVILGLGWVECATYETYFDDKGEVKLRTRKVQDPECPKPYRADQKPVEHDWRNI